MLKTPLKMLVVAAMAIPASAAFSVDASAKHYKKKHYKSHHYHGGRHYKRHNYHRGGGYYYGGHYRHRGHNKAGKYLGVALLGLGLGYVLSKSSEKNRDYHDERYERDYYRGPERPRYSTPPPRGYEGEPQNEAFPEEQGGFDFSQCVETREYQTTIVVDGQEVPAFGTACLLDDGTWVAGPMQF